MSQENDISLSSPQETKEFYKKALNPLFVDNSKSDILKVDNSANGKNTPQKRRLTETDKKLASKAPKKARQEDDDETSDGDTEAISARKKEIESVTFETPKPVDVPSDSESDAPKKNKPGPRRKKAGNLETYLIDYIRLSSRAITLQITKQDYVNFSIIYAFVAIIG